jgi:endonuclease/exonuclease/phosphatase family metal-dependent hydrolase
MEEIMKARARFRGTLLVLLILGLLAGTVPATAQLFGSANVKVMTYNVDEGTDFAAIIGVLTTSNASSSDFQAAVTATIAEVQSSHPELRAQLIAKQIAGAQPDLVGLQEAALWTIPGQQLDLLQMILAGLSNLGQHYTAVVTVPEFQINIPSLGVGFTDRDVILARTDEAALTITATGQGHYSAQVPLPAFPPYLPASTLTRGWAYVNARLNGIPFRFITTHLEDGTNPISIFALVQALQEIQLVYSPALSLLPVIIGGDFNTVANDPSSPTFATYKFMLGNGFSDAWSTTNPFLLGATCCQEDLSSSTSGLTQRIDVVFMRNHVKAVSAQLVGDQIEDSFWPSDHAAVFAVGAVSRLF